MDFKALKRSLETCFNTIVSKTRDGELPDEKDISQLTRLSRQLHAAAPEEWSGEAEDFAHLAAQLQQAVKNRDVEECVILVQSLDDAQTYCHRMFKA